MPPPETSAAAELTSDSSAFDSASAVRFYKKSTLNLLDNDDDDDDFDDESQLADELVLQRVLTRQYNSETDLRKEYEIDANIQEINEGAIYRSLSDSRLERKPKAATQHHELGFDEGIGDDHEFMKIDSNYHHAIEEVSFFVFVELYKVSINSMKINKFLFSSIFESP